MKKIRLHNTEDEVVIINGKLELKVGEFIMRFPAKIESTEKGDVLEIAGGYIGRYLLTEPTDIEKGVYTK